jgi:hypothetical protein
LARLAEEGVTKLRGSYYCELFGLHVFTDVLSHVYANVHSTKCTVNTCTTTIFKVDYIMYCMYGVRRSVAYNSTHSTHTHYSREESQPGKLLSGKIR